MNQKADTTVPEETISKLMQAGFTEYEAKVYISLLSSHPASAYSISKHSGVPHSRVYDIARRLIRKGYAVSSGSNPEFFSPLSPEELVEMIKRDNAELTRELKKTLQQIGFSSDFDPVWNLHAREDALIKVKEIIAAAEEKIFLGLWSEEFPILQEGLKAAADRGVRVFILSYGEITCNFGEVYLHERQSMEGLNARGRSIDCAVDSQVCLSGILGTRDENNAQIVWSRNQGLVNAIEGYIIHDFCLVEVTRLFRDQIGERFGPNLLKLREKFLLS